MAQNQYEQANRAALSIQEKKAWQQPSYRRLDVKEAETGINNGPEILILLS